MKKYENARIDFTTLNAIKDVLTTSGYIVYNNGSIDGEIDPVDRGM